MEKILYSFECFLRKNVSRSSFLRILLGWLLIMVADNKLLKAAFAKEAESVPRPKKNIKTECNLSSVSGKDPFKNTVAAVDALGGMGRFVKKGAVVVVKPNIGWDRIPEQAANTNPSVVAALVEMAYKAGAKRVNVFDVTCNDQRRCYENSGIQKAAQEKGAQVYFPDHWNVVKAKFPYKSDMENWPILRDAVVCDTFINVPVLKHHGLTGLTLSIKNLMGICSGTRGLMHINIGPKLVDLLDFIKPELTVIDASRVLTRNGPSGGNLADVINVDTVFASGDCVLADSYACYLMKKDPLGVKYLQEAASRNMGLVDITKADIRTINI
ncbi:MAG: DUF362 domain-containing protein [Candidatus Omnitrophica bacterium]|nr:DUF362 domain-containing protein [Candidatus Omnitrophota bacterium]